MLTEELGDDPRADAAVGAGDDHRARRQLARPRDLRPWVRPEWSKVALVEASSSQQELPGAPCGGAVADLGHCQAGTLTLLSGFSGESGRRA